MEFEAAVASCTRVEGGWEVALDATAFYPGGGGQPADRGWIEGYPVIAIADREGTIHHRLAAANASDRTPAAAEGIASPASVATHAPEAMRAAASASPGAWRSGDRLRCVVDRERRLDFMQQHTGQHLISAALLELHDAETVSIHLGESYTAVELAAPSLSNEQLLAVEERANEVIRENRSVRARFVRREELAAHRLRKAPPDLPIVRLIEIDGYDLCACGGTHVAATGEIGMVHLVGTEVIRGHLRVQWKIGRRAYRDYREASSLASAIARELGCAQAESLGVVRELRRTLADERAASARVKRRLAGLAAAALPVERLATAGGAEIGFLGHLFHGEDEGLLDEIAELAAARAASGSTARWMLCLTSESDRLLRIVVRVAPGWGIEPSGLLARLLPLVEARGGGGSGRWQGVGRHPEGAEAFLGALRAALQSGPEPSVG